MKYIYLDKDDNPVGPVDESVIVQELRAGRLHADSALRNAALREFYTVAEFPCFREFLPDSGQGPAEHTGGFAGLKKLAELRTEKKEHSALGVSMTPGDASVSRRFAAMLTDLLILLPVLLLVFLPTLCGMGQWGVPDQEEIANQQNFSKMFQAKNAQPAAQNVAAEPDAKAAPAPDADSAQAAEQSSGSGSSLGGILGRTRKKIGRISGQHNDRVAQAAGEPAPASGKKKAGSGKNPAKKAEQVSAPSSSPAAVAAEPPSVPPPQVSLRNMPGGEVACEILPNKVLYWDAVNAAPTAEGGQSAASVPRLITGCAVHPEYLQLRIGGDVRRIPRSEFQANWRKPLKWAVLAVLLYYTLSFSIFAQTFGMWFWGIFLTRSRIAEVLPLRALLYTVLMLLCGVVMIPCVLLTRRSLADWLCGTRQIGVGSVSKS